MAKSPASKYLEELGENAVAEEKLAKLLLDEAWKRADKKLGEVLRRRVAPSDIANSAVASLINDIRDGKALPQDSRHLFRMLAKRVHNKVASAARREGARRRDIKRDTDDPTHTAGKASTSEYVVMANEVAERIIEILCEEPDEMRRTVNLIGILSGVSARVIHNALAEPIWMEKHGRRTERTFQIWIDAEWCRLREQLIAEGYLEEVDRDDTD